MSSAREIAIDATDILNDLIGDYVAATNTLRDYNGRYKAGHLTLTQMSVVQKMCLSHIVLACCKFIEFWEKYRDIVPMEHVGVLKDVNSKLSKSGVLEFRNKVAGHIWDRKNKRPLYNSEIMSMLKNLVGDDVGAFLNWINTPNNNVYPNTIISIIEALRDSISAVHGIEPSEVVGR